jgi:hypothetical protein
VTGALCMPVFIKSGRRPSPLLELVDPEIVWDMSAIEIPDLGVFHGHDGVITFWLKWLAEWEDYSFETDRFEEVGDHVVFDVVLRGKSRWIGPTASSDRHMSRRCARVSSSPIAYSRTGPTLAVT